ncbi:MAG: hypothetical protein ACKO0Z_08985 [Betaproteobacteria bacterium]
MNSQHPTVIVYERELARERGLERIEQVIEQIDRFKREVQRYADRYADAENDAERAKVVNWTIHHITTNIVSNLRIDLLADSQAALARLGK